MTLDPGTQSDIIPLLQRVNTGWKDAAALVRLSASNSTCARSKARPEPSHRPGGDRKAATGNAVSSLACSSRRIRPPTWGNAICMEAGGRSLRARPGRPPVSLGQSDSSERLLDSIWNPVRSAWKQSGRKRPTSHTVAAASSRSRGHRSPALAEFCTGWLLHPHTTPACTETRKKDKAAAPPTSWWLFCAKALKVPPSARLANSLLPTLSGSGSRAARLPLIGARLRMGQAASLAQQSANQKKSRACAFQREQLKQSQRAGS